MKNLKILFKIKVFEAFLNEFYKNKNYIRKSDIN